MAAVKNQEVDYSIKPEAISPSASTEDWPLLLKNYDKRTCRKKKFLRFDGLWMRLTNNVPAQ